MSPIQQMFLGVPAGGGGDKYTDTYGTLFRYQNTSGQQRSSYIVTNNEFSSTTVHDDKPDISYPMGGWCCSGDYLHFVGYWGPYHMIKLSDLSYYNGNAASYAGTPMAYTSDYTSNLVTTYWGGYMSPQYTTDNTVTPYPSYSQVTKNNYSMSRGYIHGVASLNGNIALAIGSNDSGVNASRILKSTDGGASFSEVYSQTYYSFAGYLGSYPDYNGGKFLWWRLNTTSTNSGTNSTFSSSDGSSWTNEGAQSNGPGSPTYHGTLEIVYNKDTSKFYYAWDSSTLKESSDGVSWTSVTLPDVNRNVAVMKNGDMVGMVIDGTDAKFYKYARSGTSINWSSPTLLNTTAISSNISSVGAGTLYGFNAPSNGGIVT